MGARASTLPAIVFKEADARNHGLARRRQFRHGSTKFPTRRRRMAPFWCAAGRSACAGPTARSSPAPHGSAPPGQQRLVLGHESLGEVEAASERRRLAPGDLVVGIVRRPDPVPCPPAPPGRMGHVPQRRYTERGIKDRHGFGAERFGIEPEFAVKIDPDLGVLGVLLEPTSIVAKAWDHAEGIGRRARVWTPQPLVTGAGSIGLLAAMMGSSAGSRRTSSTTTKTVRSARSSKASAPAFTSARSPTSTASSPTS